MRKVGELLLSRTSCYLFRCFSLSFPSSISLAVADMEVTERQLIWRSCARRGDPSTAAEQVLVSRYSVSNMAQGTDAYNYSTTSQNWLLLGNRVCFYVKPFKCYWCAQTYVGSSGAFMIGGSCVTHGAALEYEWHYELRMNGSGSYWRSMLPIS
jgi:hypothetical protein